MNLVGWKHMVDKGPDRSTKRIIAMFSAIRSEWHESNEIVKEILSRAETHEISLATPRELVVWQRKLFRG